MFNRLTFDHERFRGRACIRETAIPASVILGHLASGASWEDVLREYPELDRDDIQLSLEYAAWLAQIDGSRSDELS